VAAEVSRRRSNRFSNLRAFVFLSIAAVPVLFLGLLYVHNVPRDITPEDRTYIAKIIEAAGYDLADLRNTGSFEEQIAVVRAVQDAVMRSTPEEGLIPLGSPREPKDLYYSHYAQCSDRSRVIDKALRLLGFESRYAFVLSTAQTGSPVRSLVTPNVRSHAVVEVETSRGWLIVDSVNQWISLNADEAPIGLRHLQNIRNKRYYSWHQTNSDDIYSVLNNDFVFFYGLYSRHGKFYPPYTPFPDINWGEFLLNLQPA
jgi:hypothetical protein